VEGMRGQSTGISARAAKEGNPEEFRKDRLEILLNRGILPEELVGCSQKLSPVGRGPGKNSGRQGADSH